MATNVSERIHTLQDILDALQEQASAATSDPDFDPREDMGEASTSRDSSRPSRKPAAR